MSDESKPGLPTAAQVTDHEKCGGLWCGQRDGYLPAFALLSTKPDGTILVSRTHEPEGTWRVASAWDQVMNWTPRDRQGNPAGLVAERAALLDETATWRATAGVLERQRDAALEEAEENLARAKAAAHEREKQRRRAEKAERERDDARELLEAAEEGREQAEAALARKTEVLDAANRRIVAIEAALGELQTELAEARDARVSDWARLALLVDLPEDSTAPAVVNAVAELVEAVRNATEASKDTWARAQELGGKLVEERDRYRRAADEMSLESECLEKERDAARADAERLAEEVEAVRAEREEWEDIYHSVASERDEIQEALSGAERERDRLREANAGLHERIGEMRAELDAVRDARVFFWPRLAQLLGLFEDAPASEVVAAVEGLIGDPNTPEGKALRALVRGARADWDGLHDAALAGGGDEKRLQDLTAQAAELGSYGWASGMLAVLLARREKENTDG